jgi:hypothetical protein
MNKKTLFLILFSFFLVSAAPVLAAIDSIQSLSVAIANVVWVVFTAIAVICFLFAGVLFLTAQGQPEKIKLAKSAFLLGIAGVAVGIVAFSIIKLTCGALGANC